MLKIYSKYSCAHIELYGILNNNDTVEDSRKYRVNYSCLLIDSLFKYISDNTRLS